MRLNLNTSWTFFILLSFVLVIGGLGTNLAQAKLLGLLFSFALIFYTILKYKKLSLPKGFLLYVIFLLLFLISFLWTSDKKKSFEIFRLFTTGGLFWLSFYNLQDKLNKRMQPVLIFVSLVLAFLFFLYFLGVHFSLRPSSLFLPASLVNNHNHIGDVWALVFVLLAYKYVTKKQKFNKSLVILSLFLIAISFSRSAYLAVLGGMTYLFKRLGVLEKHERIFSKIFIVFIAIFIIISFFKPTLSSRPYFLQAVLGVIDNPVGVGVGSFEVISSNTDYHMFGMNQFSHLTHNLFLEFISGMGILGFSFIAWVALVLVSFKDAKKPANILFQAVFLALTINFFFDATYFIPTMSYLWFISLGLAQEKK